MFQTHYTTNHVPRAIYDFQPRIHLKATFERIEMSLSDRVSDQETVNQFCDKFIAGIKLVVACLERMQLRELKKVKELIKSRRQV